MSKKKMKSISKNQAKALIEEIKKKYKPDFFSVKEIGGSDGKANEIEINFGWNIQE